MAGVQFTSNFQYLMTVPMYYMSIQSFAATTIPQQIKHRNEESDIASLDFMLLNMTSTLSLLHFNDVYRVTPQKISSHPLETIDVTQFTALLHDLRDQWTLRDDGNRDGLVFFSGDVFSPSIESSVTRGSHMVIFTVHYSNKMDSIMVYINRCQ